LGASEVISSNKIPSEANEFSSSKMSAAASRARASSARTMDGVGLEVNDFRMNRAYFTFKMFDSRDYLTRSTNLVHSTGVPSRAPCLPSHPSLRHVIRLSQREFCWT